MGVAGAVGAGVLTLLHHADVHAALEAAGLAVTAVVLGDVAGAVEGAGEAGLALHAPSDGGRGGGQVPLLNAETSIYANTLKTMHLISSNDIANIHVK